MAACSEAERDVKIQRLLNEEAWRLFDLSEDLMLRSVVLRLADHDQVLIFTMHHIASDGLSMEIFLQELSDLYIAFSEGNPSPLPDLPIQYSHFACWERHLPPADLFAKQLSYWQMQLASSPPVIALPSDRSRPPRRSLHGDRYAIMIRGSLVDLSGDMPMKVYHVHFDDGAFKTLLYRYTVRTTFVLEP
jgi:hypothetical protein